MSYLRSGIFLAPFHNLTENPTLALERDMELLQHLDRLNYHEAWIGEHHSGGFEIIALARRCSSPRPPSARGTSGWAPASRRCPTTTRSSSPTAWCSSTT